MNDTMNALRDIASDAGWDEYTLLLQICILLDGAGTSQTVIDELQAKAAEED